MIWVDICDEMSQEEMSGSLMVYPCLAGVLKGSILWITSSNHFVCEEGSGMV